MHWVQIAGVVHWIQFGIAVEQDWQVESVASPYPGAQVTQCVASVQSTQPAKTAHDPHVLLVVT